MAAEACLGIKINKTQIIVSTPIEEYDTQVFTFGEAAVEKDEENWLQLVDKFLPKSDHRKLESKENLDQGLAALRVELKSAIIHALQSTS